MFKGYFQKHKRFCVGFFSASAVIILLGASARYVTNFDIIQLDQNKIYDSNGTQRISVGSTNAITGDLTVSGSVTHSGAVSFSSYIIAAKHILFGTSGTAISTTSVNAGAGYSVIPVHLIGTVDAAKGSALYASGNDGSKIIASVSLASNDAVNVIGIAESAVSTGSVVNCIISGFALALTSGTVNIGDVLVTTQAAKGYLAANAGTTYGAEVGVALSTGTAAGGLTLIKIRK